MKNIFCLLALALAYLCSNAQKANPEFYRIDSLISTSAFENALQQIEIELPKSQGFEETIWLTSKKAQALISLGKLSDAETLLNNITFAKENAPLQGMILTNMGYLYLNKGRNDLALRNLEDALRKFQESNNLETREGARCLSTLGLAYSSTGKYKQAESNQNMALQIRLRIFGNQSEDVAASYNDLGLVYSEIDPDKALEYFEMALPIYESLHGKDHPKIAIASTNIGFSYLKLKLFGDAVNNFETALSIWRKIYPNGHPNEALTLSHLGQTYVKMGDNRTALEYFEKALTIFKNAYGSKHSDISQTLNQIGNIKLKENNFGAALQSFQQAIIANSQHFENNDITKNPLVAEYYNAKVLLYSLQYKAQALEALHYGQTLKLTDLRLALSCLYSCDSLIDDIRHHSTDESDKFALGALAAEVYEDGVRVSQAMSEMVLKPGNYKEAAFYFAEKSKSAVLQESIAESNAKSFAGIPANLLDDEKNIKSQIALLVQKLARKPSSEEERILRGQLFNLDQTYSSFIKELEKKYPNYFNLKFNQTSPTVIDLQQQLGNETALLSYFIAEESKRLYIFIITQKQFKIKNLTLPDGFDRYCNGFNNSLFYNDLAIYKQSAAPLSRLVIPHLPASIKELIIIPAGRLGTIPFEALVTKKISDEDFKTIPFLIKRFAISYEFSAGLLNQKSKSQDNGNHETASIFLCAPVLFSGKDDLNELPGTESEVNTIAGLFSDKSFVAKFSDATESLIKSGTLSTYDYLHFATHGVVDEVDPELSRIFLNNSPSEDGNLFAGEIYNLNLNANLAVLSACQTGLGKLSKGEGVIGLSRALTYAGAKNIIVSFWSVADESTSQLMTNFYDILLKNKYQNFSLTLQQAKVRMISEGRFVAPYYWAPFVLIGK
jgi:CHAT domain-containing protein/tetratricopeptide (TPR) repeat protein